MWVYHQKCCDFLHDGAFDGSGYSGTGIGRNNPGAQIVPNTGPIPRGIYTIGPAHDDPVLGPCVMALTPSAETDTFGRSGFYIHGDNARHDASHGCIILGPAIRKLIAESGDTDLEVVE